jgi:dihydroorotate dehydrogenase
MVEKIWPYIDVIELNFSCPNQHGVSDGIQKSQKLLKAIIKKAQETNERMAQKSGKVKKPILVKI